MTHGKKMQKKITSIGNQRILVVIYPKIAIENLQLTTQMIYLCISSSWVIMNKLQWMVILDKLSPSDQTSYLVWHESWSTMLIRVVFTACPVAWSVKGHPLYLPWPRNDFQRVNVGRRWIVRAALTQAFSAPRVILNCLKITSYVYPHAQETTSSCKY